MKQRDYLHGLIRGPLITLAILASTATILYFYPRLSPTSVTEAQVPRQQRRTRTAAKTGTQPRRKTETSPSTFNHEHHRLPRTKLNCSNCHTIVTREAPDEIAAATKPTIKGYPYHDSCLECHRKASPQFFRGATPSICTVCHTRVSPRATAADVYSKYPKQNDLTLRQLPGYFPHKAHERVIIKQTEAPEGADGSFVSPVSFSRSTKGLAVASRVACAECHAKDERAPAPVSVGGEEKMFTPAAGTFKNSPSGHASCFGCHWSANEPKKDKCDGCHLTSQAYVEKARHLWGPTTLVSFKDWPREWPRRVSIKFRHEEPKEHQDEACVTCHATILQSDALDAPDVSVAACFKCHRSRNPSIVKEMNEEDEDIAEGRNNDSASLAGTHTCTGCHASVIGRMPPPCSHFLLFGDTYFAVEDYPKSAKELEARCKK